MEYYNKLLANNKRWVASKIEEDPKKPRWIKTVWGSGYRFET